MRKIKSLKDELEKIQKEIEQLQNFRPTLQTKKFLRQLIGEKMNVQNKIKKLEIKQTQTIQEKQQRRSIANQQRSHKMRRSWRYFEAIKNNYLPNRSTKIIRREFSKFKKGLESDISDIIWRNPSP